MKIIIALIFMMTLLMSSPGFAATSGSLTVTGTGSYNALNLTSNFNAVVANATETWSVSGNPTFSMTVLSSNGGLKNGTSVVPYTVSYSCTGATATTVTISTTAQTIATRAPGNGNSGSCNGTLTIAFTGVAAANLYQGTFTDTLTFCYKTAASCYSSPTLVLTSTAIPAVVSLTVSADANASSLPMTATQTDLLVGSVTEVSNSNTGYNILVKSANGALLKNGVDTLGYTIKYGTSGATAPTTTDAVIRSVVAGYYSGNSSNVTISYAPPVVMTQGSYTDVLTFTIQAQ